jgi:hypothetical protein
MSRADRQQPCVVLDPAGRAEAFLDQVHEAGDSRILPTGQLAVLARIKPIEPV